ncbi:hypothetical protein LXJ15735_04600 [Lacrimispora xylanolytica]
MGKDVTVFFSDFSSDVIQERLMQAEEMSQIWDKSPEAVQMYLKGCMATAAALASQNCGPRKVS